MPAELNPSKRTVLEIALRVAPPGWNSNEQIRPCREERRKSGSQLTRRWREVDSNPRSRFKGRHPPRAGSARLDLDSGTKGFSDFPQPIVPKPLRPQIWPAWQAACDRADCSQGAHRGLSGVRTAQLLEADEVVIQVPQMLHPLAVDDAACMGEHKDRVPPREPLTSVC